MSVEEIVKLSWGSRMVDELRDTEGFRTIDRGSVKEMTFMYPLGYDKSKGEFPPTDPAGLIDAARC